MIRDEIYKFFASYVYQHTGISYKEVDYYRLDSRFNALVSHFGLADVDELYQKYKGVVDKEMHTVLIDLCTNNETYFMRDLKPFKALGKEVMTYLEEEMKVVGPINIWSAASSTGQEPYSILMAIDTFGGNDKMARVQLTATDISQEALKRAEDGIYTGLEVQRGLPANMLIKYFSKEEEDWHINSELKSKVRYGTLNLLTEDFPANQYHIIFCRNVLIYQEQENKTKILEKVHKALKVGGLLFMGAGESLIGVKLPFKQVEMGKAFCYEKTE